MNTDESNVDTKTSPNPLRLSVLHLMLLMLTCSISFALLSQSLLRFKELTGPAYWQLVLNEVTSALVAAFSVAGLLALVLAMQRGQIRALSPGHAILCVLGLGELATLLLSATSNALLDFESQSDWHFIAIGWVMLVEGLAWCAVAVLVRRTWWWSGTAIAACVCYALQGAIIVGLALDSTTVFGGFFWIWYAAFPWLQLIQSLLLLIAVVMDRRAGLARDWLHYSGVIALLGLGLANLIIHYIR